MKGKIEQKNIEFCVAHRLMNHKGRCKDLHGHNYYIPKLLVSGKVDEDTGMVIDFGEVKRIFDEFDHKVILHKDDPLVGVLKDHTPVVELDFHPTVENLARYFRMKLEDKGLFVIKLKVHETKDNSCPESSERSYNVRYD